jgi:putative membrane protein insertion efficiency factor
MVKVLVGMIRLYQRWLSPWLGQNCRFYPSCSQYAVEALRAHGVVYGLLLGAWRILRCNPFCKGGHDPVPEKRHGH